MRPLRSEPRERWACVAVPLLLFWLLLGCSTDSSAEERPVSTPTESASAPTPTRGEMMVYETEPAESVIAGETPASPEPGPANSLRAKLGPGSASGAPLTLHGHYNLGVDVIGRYGGSFPAAIYVVAVSRESGRVHVRDLTVQDDVMPVHRGAAASPSIVLEGPDGPTSAGMSESAFFSIDLKAHLGLADAADVYDVFLWLEDVASDLVTASKPEEEGEGIGMASFGRPASIATVRSAAGSDALELSLEGTGAGRRIVGRVGQARVSIVAVGVESRACGWTCLNSEEEGSGLQFEVELAKLLPGSNPETRVVVFAITSGRRSALLDTAAPR